MMDVKNNMKITYYDNLTARIGNDNAFCICISCRKKHPMIIADLEAKGIAADELSIMDKIAQYEKHTIKNCINS